MGMAKDTRKHEKHRIAITGSGGALVVLGGVSVLAALAVASVSVFKFRKTRNTKTTGAATDELNKGNDKAGMTSAENGAQPLGIIGKMSEGETSHENEPLDENKEKSIEYTLTDCATQNAHLAKYRVNPQEEYEAITVLPKTPDVEVKSIEAKDEVVLKTPHDEVEYKQEEDEALMADEEKSGDATATDHGTQHEHLATYQVNPQVVEAEVDDEAKVVISETPQVEYEDKKDEASKVLPRTPQLEVEENEALNKGEEEKTEEDTITDHVFQKQHLEIYQVNQEEIEGKEKGEAMVVLKAPNTEVEDEEDEILNEDGEKSGGGSVEPQEINAEEVDEAITVVQKIPNVEIEYKEEDNKALNESEEKSNENAITDHATQTDDLTKYQVNPQELEAEEDDEAIMVVPRTPHVECKDKEDGVILVVPRTPDVEYKDKESEPIMVVPEGPRVEVEYKEGFEREQGYEHGEYVKKDEELAEEIKVDPQSDENSSIDEDGADTAERVAQIQHMEEEQEEHYGNGILKREERAMEMAPQLNRCATEDKLEVTEEESGHVEEEQEYAEGKSSVEKEKESSKTNEDDDEETASLEGMSYSSVESNIDAIWPTDAVKDILMEIKQRKIDNQVSEDKTEEYVKVEAEEKSLKNDNVYATNCCEIEDSGKSVHNPRKRYIKELLLDLSNTRTWMWAILVFLLVFFVVGLS